MLKDGNTVSESKRSIERAKSYEKNALTVKREKFMLEFKEHIVLLKQES